MNFKSLITAIILQIALPKFLVFGLTADFTLSMESACAPSLVVFYNHSTPE